MVKVIRGRVLCGYLLTLTCPDADSTCQHHDCNLFTLNPNNSAQRQSRVLLLVYGTVEA